MNPISSMDEQFIKKLTQIIDENLHNEEFGASELAAQLGISRVTLYRKVKSIIKKSVSEYIRETRLHRALELLENKAGNVSEISYKVGFNNPVYFNKCFRDFYGITPGDVLKGIEPIIEKPGNNNRDKKKRIIYYIIPILIIPFIIIIVNRLIVSNEKSTPNKGDKILVIEQFDDFSNEKSGRDIVNRLQEQITLNVKDINGIHLNEKLITKRFKSRNIRDNTLVQEYNADFIIEGKINKLSNGELIVRIQLTDLKSENSYNKMFDTYPIQEIVTETNSDELITKFTLSMISIIKSLINENIEYPTIRMRGAKNIQALELYGEAMDYYRAEQRFEDSITYFWYLSKNCLEKAIKLDSLYQAPYERLGWLYYKKSKVEIGKNVQKEILFLDSALYFSNIAFQIQPNLYDEISALSFFNVCSGNFEVGEILANELIKMQPENHMGHFRLATVFQEQHNFVEALKKMSIANELINNPPQRFWIVRAIVNCFWTSGFLDIAEKKLVDLEVYNDSNKYFIQLAHMEAWSGNLEKAISNIKKTFKNDTNNINLMNKFFLYNYIRRDFEKSNNYIQKADSCFEDNDIMPNINGALGHLYMLNGNYKKANLHLNSEIQKNKDCIEFNHRKALVYDAHYNLACLYSAKGDTDKALEYLEMLENKEFCAIWILTGLRMNPMLDNIRTEPEFLKVQKNLERKFNKQRDKIEKLLKKIE